MAVCRGLKGWITVALDLNEFAANELAYLNLNPNDPPMSAKIVAARSLLIPLTRAVHTLVIAVREPGSRVALQLRDATDDPAMPFGVVEWVDADLLAETVPPPRQFRKRWRFSRVLRDSVGFFPSEVQTMPT